MSRIFVSHSSKDNRQAEALRGWLVAQDPPLASEIFLDTDIGTGLKLGVKWKNELIRANSRCEAVICLLSHNWESSPECLAEYRTAENLGKQILCARLQDRTGRHTSEWQHTDLFPDGLPDEDVETIPVRGGPPVLFAKAGLHQLRDAIRGAGIAAENFVWPPPAQPDRAPYRGWEPFEELDAGVFFGRDAQIVRAVDMLRAMRSTGVDSLFVVLGPSGSGKSSFLRAGLLPRLRREDRHFVLLDILRPERHALTGDTGLAHTVSAGRRRLGLERPSLGDIEIACTADAAALRTLLAECRHAAAHRVPDVGPDAAPPTLVLPLDQAEELFSADAGPEAAAFLQLIAELAKPDVDGQRLGLVVVATIRTDRYEVMQTAPQLAGLTSEVFDDLKPMPDNQFREVITGPAHRAGAGCRGLRIAPDLVNDLLEDAAEGGDTLPLLALTLRRLYDRYAATGELTLASYQAMGGMGRVVQTAVDEVLAANPAERGRQLAALRAAFVPWLATIDPDNDQPMRRVARYGDLPQPSRALIDAFVEKRLLVKDQRGGEVVVEVALESLLRQWNELAGWLREERQSLVAADDIEHAATAWHTHHGDPAWLLTGTRLADAEALAAKPGYRDRLAQRPPCDYLAASRLAEDQKLQEEEERRQEKLHHAEEVARLAQERQQAAEAHAGDLRRRSRILRAVLAGTAIIAVIAIVGAVVAAVDYNRANRAEHEATREARDALAAQLDTKAAAVFSRVTADSDIQALTDTLAARLLRSDPAASRGAFYTATTALDTTRIIIPTLASMWSVAYSPDGHTIASGSADGTARLWNLTDPAHPTPLGQPRTDHADAVGTVAFSPDGHTLASGSFDHTVRLWSLADPAHPTPLGAPLTGHTNAVASVAFSPDGHTLASGSLDHTIRLWSLTDPMHAGPLGQPLQGHTSTVQSVAFSPDGHTLASGSADATVRLWNLDTAVPLQGHTDTVFSVAFSPDGHTLASGSADATVRLWNITDPAHPDPLGPPLPGHSSAVTSVAFSPDGHTLASGSFDKTIRLWNLTDPLHAGPLGQPLAGHTDIVTGVAFSSGGHTLASGSLDYTVRLWNLTDAMHPGPLGQPLRGHTNAVFSVAFSRDGHTLASGSADASVRLWNLTDPAHPGPLGQPLAGHTDTVTGVAFSPDGHTLASGSLDYTVRLWNLTDAMHPGPLGQPLRGHTNALTSVALSPNGHTLASGSTDHTVRLWPTPLDATVATLCSKLTSDISHRDWHDWISSSIDYITLCPNLPPPQN